MFDKLVVIDAQGHLQGRLASYVAKELLSGQRIVVVRAEGINISGSLFRNRVKFSEFLNKWMNHNPRRGFQHFRAPSKIFWRCIRGMLPHLTPRGAAALQKLKIFEGVPAPYDRIKKQVVVDALKVQRLKNHRPYCTLGDLCNSVGWSKQTLVDQLETKRKTRATTYFQKKLQQHNNRAKELQLPQVKVIKAQLAQYGY
ncbi:hypothetical protein IMG5_153090 [Ichthyophthirius multifiliis]|uniref:60S ribosomal protein L13a n=1 Tax=Ichthyophthirius multifiliis TaxID=5932 RepID=G0QYX3_ICHMU|nr:hypothetical protein IMG5_153090 [Ichthyophthirius multifiliis]EGR29588.1 hypothetical protein IMG5_153090 [Ichthyophthirius multifiliis]|eukprot:XP_004030824.1 hypothetical protein IMG5_153090 [Ichthyophthirius multifiliis]